MANTENRASAWDNLAISMGQRFEDGFWNRNYVDNIKNAWKGEFENLPFIRHFQSSDGRLVYVNNKAYHSIAVAVAKWKAAQAIQDQLRKLLDFQNNKAKKEQEANRLKWEEQHASLRKTIIERSEAIHKDYGSIEAKPNSSDKIVACDKCGNPVYGALIMWYEGDMDIEEIVETHTSETTFNKLNNRKTTVSSQTSIKSKNFITNKVFVIDLAPQIRVNSSKNIVLTKVQGRDYTRKELVSGGDLCFTVSGEIMSNYADVYPARDVEKFISIMQHGGIVSVNNLMFGQFKVENIIIQSYSLDTPKYQNIQPYSFTCVAVEPNESIQIVDDTIKAINYDLSTSSILREQKWYNLILNGVLNNVQNAAGSFISSTLDALTFNI